MRDTHSSLATPDNSNNYHHDEWCPFRLADNITQIQIEREHLRNPTGLSLASNMAVSTRRLLRCSTMYHENLPVFTRPNALVKQKVLRLFPNKRQPPVQSLEAAPAKTSATP